MRQWAYGVLAVAILAACCPIPLSRDITERPGIEVVVSSPDGKLVDQSKVTVRRYISGPPPATERNRWHEVTADDGVALFPEIVVSEIYLPLMMHGVNWYSWQVCAEHPTLGSASETHNGGQPMESRFKMNLVLDPAKKDCGWEEMPGP